VPDCSILIVARFNLGGEEEECRRRLLSSRSRDGLFSRLDRLMIEAQAPMNSGDAEGLASVMEGCK